uniref:Uncharacterized protein n=1 Tax=Knipowitschia caucasica TaxID=637954 RepID=A0AAV2K0N0_KNICA
MSRHVTFPWSLTHSSDKCSGYNGLQESPDPWVNGQEPLHEDGTLHPTEHHSQVPAPDQCGVSRFKWEVRGITHSLEALCPCVM